MVSNDYFKKQFLAKLEERFYQEFDSAPFHSPYMQKLKEWWMSDQGLNRVNDFDLIFKRIEPFLSQPYSGLRCLDVGCGNGASLVSFSRRKIFCVGLEYDLLGKDLELAKLRCKIHNFEANLIKGNALLLPFQDKTFDICLSNAVIEHIKNFEDHIKEVYRVLKSGSLAYFYTRNRIWPYDSHTRSYFIQWFPHRYLEMYWNATVGFKHKKNLSLWPVTYPRLRKVLKKQGFKIVADVKSDFLNRPRRSLKYNLIKSLMKFGFPLEVFHAGCMFIVRKDS